jgi:hypothetical protein
MSVHVVKKALNGNIVTLVMARALPANCPKQYSVPMEPDCTYEPLNDTCAICVSVHANRLHTHGLGLNE